MIVPEKGEWVEVYFMNGDMNKPVYLAICNELKRDDNTYTVPEWYTGDPKVRVLYQSPVTKKGIKLDESSGDMLLDSDTVTLIVESTEPFVLGNNLKTWAEGVDDAISALSTWAQTGTGAGGSIPKFLNTPPIETTFPANALSTKIKGQ
jgi:hypothetical protein